MFRWDSISRWQYREKRLRLSGIPDNLCGIPDIAEILESDRNTQIWRSLSQKQESNQVPIHGNNFHRWWSQGC